MKLKDSNAQKIAGKTIEHIEIIKIDRTWDVERIVFSDGSFLWFSIDQKELTLEAHLEPKTSV